MLASKIFDAIVVGSGAAGSFAAKTLTEAGLDTLLLEAGPRLDPSRDFPPPGPADRPGSLTERIRAAFSGQAVQARCTGYRGFARHLYVDDRENPYTTSRGKPFYWIRGRQVGGRLHTWGRLTPRMSDFELRAGSLDGRGDDWPICYADLAPYYDRVEELLGLEGHADGLPQLPDGRYRAPHPLTAQEREFQRIVESRWPERRVIQSRLVRQQLRETPLPLLDAEKTGRLTLCPDSVARSLSSDPHSGKASGVEFANRLSGRIESARGRLVFLCASAFESVRILLNSRSTRHPEGIGASSGVLGRYITDHLFFTRTGLLAGHAEDDPGPPADPYDFGRAHGFYIPRFRNLGNPHPDFVRGYGICGCIGRGGPWWWMGAFGEMLPRAENRITLDPSRRDAWGVPVARIECAHGANDRALIADARRVVDEMIDAAGLDPPSRWSQQRLAELLGRKSFAQPGVVLPGLAVHEVGGARMGSEAGSSVLDPSCRCWDAENVVVSDGACFASGGYQNPALTIMALTVRAAERAVADFSEIAL
jgi:choline dehydrogenase-like flavoprotein